jgi:hypothetical protein
MCAKGNISCFSKLKDDMVLRGLDGRGYYHPPELTNINTNTNTDMSGSGSSGISGQEGEMETEREGMGYFYWLFSDYNDITGKSKSKI